MSSPDIPKVDVTGLSLGTYMFQLTVMGVGDDVTDSDVTVINVVQGSNSPPQARAGDDVTVMLPTDFVILNASLSSDDVRVAKYVWTKDQHSPAAGMVLANDTTTGILYLCSLTTGQYIFHLRVVDDVGDEDRDDVVVTVMPDPNINDTVVLKLAAHLKDFMEGNLLNVLSKLTNVLHESSFIGKTKVHLVSVGAEDGTQRVVLRLLVKKVSDSSQPYLMSGLDVVATVRGRLRAEPGLLGYHVTSIDTLICENNCSGHGVCDAVTRHCVCSGYWVENVLRVHFTDGMPNCDWSLIYVIIISGLTVIIVLVIIWISYCIIRRTKTKPHLSSSQTKRRSGDYTLLNLDDDDDGDDDRESDLDLLPKAHIHSRRRKGHQQLSPPSQQGHRRHLLFSESPSGTEEEETVFENRNGNGNIANHHQQRRRNHHHHQQHRSTLPANHKSRELIT